MPEAGQIKPPSGNSCQVVNTWRYHFSTLAPIKAPASVTLPMAMP